jgi:cyclin B
MLIASKYEEIYAPEVNDFVFITDSAYTRDQIISQECEMLTALDFDVTISSSFRFLERFIKISKSDSLIFNYARYIIELPLIDNSMLKWKPSLIACSAIYISKKVLRRQ